MFSAPYYSIIPELVPVRQRGSAGSWVAFLQASAGLATLQGDGAIGGAGVYALLVGLKRLEPPQACQRGRRLLHAGAPTQNPQSWPIFWANFKTLIGLSHLCGAQPGWCEPEAPAPPLPAPHPTQPRQPAGAVCVDGFFSSFGHRPFAAMFGYCLLQVALDVKVAPPCIFHQ
jgi:hypothetical protein